MSRKGLSPGFFFVLDSRRKTEPCGYLKEVFR